ncbi:MAG: ATP-binding cassette domain-containing protein [Weeksellaceae bacterium]|jgi:ABC-type sugar transport system ATPase subunit|nr:ATP-binding cassette domain-containing protein [Weeksellaceae bacterium]
MWLTSFGLSLSMLKSRNLSFEYRSGKPVLRRINFIVQEGEFISILGESGSGKSTLLKLIYGLEDATIGEILYQDEPVKGPAFQLVPGHPKMKFVTQEFDLSETVSVAENTGKYLSNSNLIKKKRNINKALKAVGLYAYRNELPSKMSGGQRQRISIAAALAAKPEVLLLDEPYGHLDQSLKFEIRNGIREWAAENRVTVLITTHDIHDAMGYSDRIFVIKQGRIIQMDKPMELRNHPKSEYVAGLLGVYSALDSMEMRRLFKIKIDEKEKAILYPDEVVINPKGHEFLIEESIFQGHNFLNKAVNEKAVVYFYSEQKPDKQFIYLKIKQFRTVKK